LSRFLLTLSVQAQGGYHNQSVCWFVCVQRISKVAALPWSKLAWTWRRWWFKSLLCATFLNFGHVL